jgi:hypothetical protein
MLVSKVSNEQVPVQKRMDETVMTAKRHRHLLRLSMPEQRSKQLAIEKTLRVLSEIQRRCWIDDEVAA